MGEERSSSKLLQALKETSSKVSSFSDALQDHLNNDEFDAKKDDLDFLHIKNTLMLSYLIDLSHLLHLTITMTSSDENTSIDDLSSNPKIKACVTRLHEMRVALERIRPMEKKLRYQIDKLLALSSGVFAVTDDDATGNADTEEKNDKLLDDADGEGSKIRTEEDPLSFKPNLDEWMGEDNNDEQDDESNDLDNDDNDESGDSNEEDYDLKAAKSAIEASSTKTSKSNVYQAPRLFSTGMDSYTQKEKQVASERKQRRRQHRLLSQNSELIQTLQSQYTDKPEEDDVLGGTGGGANMTNMSAAKRKFEVKDRNKTKFEEEQFIRLVPTRKEKKERNRVYAEERSNLRQISDLGNLSKGISAFSNGAGGDDDNDFRGNRSGGEEWEGRFENGKRKRGFDMGTERGVRRVNQGANKLRTSNPLQKELYGVSGSSGKTSGKKKKKSKR